MAAPDVWSSRSVPTLRGERVLLRRLRPTDIEDRRVLGRGAEENRMYGGSARTDEPMSQAQAEVWYARGAEKTAQVRWAIEVDGHCIGSCTLTGSGAILRYAIGISAAALWNMGLGTQATRLVLAYAFGLRQVERVELRVLAFNKRAIRSYEKVGFKVSGVLKDSAEIDGEHFDDWIMTIDRAAFEGFGA